MEQDKDSINYHILKRDFIIVNITVGIALLVMVIHVLLQQWGILPLSPCLFHEVMHMYCPGCGGTRAGLELMRGHIFKSLYYNPAVITGILLILSYEIGVFLTIVKKNGKKYYIASGWPAYIYVIFIFVFAIIRDILLVGFKFDMLHDFIII